MICVRQHLNFNCATITVCEYGGGENLFLTKQLFDYGPFALKGVSRDSKKQKEKAQDVTTTVRSGGTDGVRGSTLS